MSKILIKMKDVVKTYDEGSVKALRGITLEIAENDFVSIIGPSGSGKSTLLNMIGALDLPDSGEILINDIDLTTDKDLSGFRSENIGFVFQLHNLIPNLSVQDNVEIPLIGKDISEKDANKKSQQILESLGLGDKIDQNPTKLSGGQRQRVAIARALINDPPIILADEPTGALDQKTGKKILGLLQQLHEESNVTLIIVTHDPNIANLANRTIEIMDGKLTAEYENKKKEYTKNDENTGSQPPKAKVYDKQGKEVPDKVLSMIEEDDEMVRKQEEIDEQRIIEEEYEIIETSTDQSTGNNRIDIEELPDLAEFMESEEFLRMGTDARIPHIVQLGGKEFKVYIRPLGANEFHKLQLQSLRDKTDLNYLAVEKACTDSNGRKLPPRLLNKLGFDVINNIGEAIRVASGKTESNDNNDAIIENLLNE